MLQRMFIFKHFFLFRIKQKKIGFPEIRIPLISCVNKKNHGIKIKCIIEIITHHKATLNDAIYNFGIFDFFHIFFLNLKNVYLKRSNSHPF